MVVSLQSPFALIVSGIPHAYQGVSDQDSMHHYRFYLSPKDMPMFLASLQHAYGQYADMRELSEIALSIFWRVRYYGRRDFETARFQDRTMTRYWNRSDAALHAIRTGTRYAIDLYFQDDLGYWSRYKRYDAWVDALRAANNAAKRG